MSRIYEVAEGFHIDLKRVIGMRQFIDTETKGKRRQYHCWIEIYMDCDQIMVIDYIDFYSLNETYTVILNAWRHYKDEYRQEDDLK